MFENSAQFKGRMAGVDTCVRVIESEFEDIELEEAGGTRTKGDSCLGQEDLKISSELDAKEQDIVFFIFDILYTFACECAFVCVCNICMYLLYVDASRRREQV